VTETVPLVLREGAEIDALRRSNEDLSKRYRAEIMERRALHNAVQELKGNIRVYARVRPMLREELEAGETEAVAVRGDSVVVKHPVTGKPSAFAYDAVFGPSTSQADIFADTRPLMSSVLDGFHVCIFAYGQTGAGKTHTMEGPAGDPGVNYRALDELFRLIDERRGDWEYRVRVSMVEIYNEQLRDLLNEDAGAARKLDIRHVGQSGGRHGAKHVVITGLTTMVAEAADAVRRITAFGYRNRAVGTTNVNEHSSRSHCIVSVDVTGRNPRAGMEMASVLNLVDLAGSERTSKTAATGARLLEAQFINRSLAALGQVMHCIAARDGFIPYRNSKLTYLLQNSLGGNCKTVMMCNVSPAASQAGESKCSLVFAARVAAVELGKARKNVAQGPASASSAAQDDSKRGSTSGSEGTGAAAAPTSQKG
jgi:kinesin family protein C2/C3